MSFPTICGRWRGIHSAKMEILDAQVHLNQLLPTWQTDPIDQALKAAVATMDAVGVDAVIIYESRGFDSKNRPNLGRELPNGAIRAEFPYSALAVETYPERFAYIWRIDARDEELEQVAADVSKKPGVVGLRIVPTPNAGEIEQLENGGFDRLFAAAQDSGLPLFTWLPGRAHLLEPILKKYPKLQVILDHVGVGVAPPIKGGPLPPTMASSLTPTLEGRLAELEGVLALAQYPNLGLKWCHAPVALSAEEYPYRDMQPLLRRTLDAFGAERVVWASDYTVSKPEQSWAQTLHYLLDSDVMSETETEWFFGKAARKLLNWPKANSAT